MYGAIINGLPTFAGQAQVTNAAAVAQAIVAHSARTGEPSSMRVTNAQAGVDCVVSAVGPGYVVEHVKSDGSKCGARFLPALAFHLFSVLNERICQSPSFTVARPT